MTKQTPADLRPSPSPWLSPGNWWKVYLAGWLPIGISYLLILGLFANVSAFTLVATWLANVLFPSIAGMGVAWLIFNIFVRLSVRGQMAIHTVGAVVFATLWAMAAFRLLQLSSGLLRGDWSVTNWSSAALAWQLFQGLAIYFTIVSASYAYWALRKLSEATEQVPSQPAQTGQRVYAKTADGLTPLNEEDISLARTMDGLTFLFVGQRKLDSRMTLSELEDALPSDNFLRVHRSAIVNLDHIQSIEQAGNGRKTIHLKNSVSLETSRAGASALKTRLALV